MSTTIAQPLLSIEAVTQFLYRETRFLDDKRWDEWLALFAPEVEFWMPSWDDDDRLTEDPRQEISLIWYGHKGGLKDRVFASGPNDRAPPACRSHAHRTTSRMSRSWSRPATGAGCASTG